jgi:hypothetical protein
LTRGAQFTAPFFCFYLLSASQKLKLFMSDGNGKFGGAASCVMIGEMVVAQMRWPSATNEHRRALNFPIFRFLL